MTDGWIKMTEGESTFEDVKLMISTLQSSKDSGPYEIHVHPRMLGLLLSSNRRYIRRRARRLGVRFKVMQNTHPRVYMLQLEKRA